VSQTATATFLSKTGAISTRSGLSWRGTYNLGVAAPKTRKIWTFAECNVLRACYGTVKIEHLVVALNRPRTSIYAQAAWLGLTRTGPERFSVKETEFLTQKNSAGCTDRIIAKMLKRDYGLIVSYRRKLRLPSNQQGKQARDNRQSARTERAEAHKDLAREYNLPEDLSPTQVRLLLLLAHKGFLTRRQLATLLNVSVGALTARHFVGLRQKGLLGSLSNRTYVLSSLAMDLLSGKDHGHDVSGK
jgi:hypothetical protein